jgi:hypothetical protein
VADTAQIAAYVKSLFIKRSSQVSRNDVVPKYTTRGSGKLCGPQLKNIFFDWDAARTVKETGALEAPKAPFSPAPKHPPPVKHG